MIIELRNNIPEENQPIVICLQGNDIYNDARILTGEEEDALIKKCGIDLKPKGKNMTACSMTLEELSNMKFKKRSSIVEGLIKVGQIIMIKAQRKHFKSWVSVDIGACAASGESMGGRFFAPKPSVVCLVDAEMPLDELQGRLNLIKSLYKNKSLLSANFRIISLQYEGKDLDLSDDDGQSWLKPQILDVDIVIIDNLGLVIPDGTEGHAPKWRRVFKFAKELTKLGIIVVIVHHENKDGKTRGTSKMPDDVDLLISLKKPEKQESTEDDIVEFHFEASRYLHGKQKIPFSIRYYTEDGVFKRDIKPIEGSGSQPESLLSNEEKQRHEVQVAMLVAARTADRNLDLKPEDRFIQKKGIKTLFPDRSDTNLTDHFNKLCDAHLLSKDGKGKGTKYYVYPGPEKPETM